MITRSRALSLSVQGLFAVLFSYLLIFIIDFEWNIGLWGGEQRMGFLGASFVLWVQFAEFEKLTGHKKYFITPFITVLCLYTVASFIKFDLNMSSWSSNHREIFSMISFFISLIIDKYRY